MLHAGGESGSANTVRDPCGFAVKFYTEDGNWDLVGNNTPIFFIRDPILVREWCMCALSLVPMLLVGGEKKSLVSTIRACA